MSQEFTSLQDIGRNQLLKELAGINGHRHSHTLKGMGDDAAVIQESGDLCTVITTDTFVEGVDFDPTYTPFTHFGSKMVESAVSDIYAMNAMPGHLLVNLALSNRMSKEMLEQMYAGIESACKRHQIEIVGGDLTGNHQNLVVSLSITGKATKEKLSFRSGALTGDAICVTGDLGGALAGLRILMREKQYWEKHGNEAIQPDLADYTFVVEKQLLPKARRDVIEAFSQQGIVPTSMIDLTKGVIHEVKSLCEASDLGAYLYQAALPIAIETRHVADEMQEDVDRYALFGGEDLELIFTLPEKEVDRFIQYFKDFSVIGRMVPSEEGLQMQTAEGDVLSFEDLS
jgi:thiamine-monophosphate kinase